MNNNIYHKKYLKYKKKYLDLKKDIEGGFFTSSSNPTRKLRDAMLKEYHKYKNDAMKKYPKIYYNAKLSDDNIKKITEDIKSVLENKIPIEIRTANLKSHIKKEGDKETIDLTPDLVQTELAKIMTEGAGSTISKPEETDNIYPLTKWTQDTVIYNLKKIHKELMTDQKMQKYFERMRNSEDEAEKNKFIEIRKTEPEKVLLENIKKLNDIYEEAQKCVTFFKNGKFSSYIKTKCEKYKIKAINEIAKIFQKINDYETKQSKVIDKSVGVLNNAQFELNKLGIKYSRAAGESPYKNYTPENLKDVQQKALRQKKLELIQDLNLRGIEREEINLAKIQEYIMKQETVIDKENVKNLKKIAKTIEKEIKEVTNM